MPEQGQELMANQMNKVPHTKLTKETWVLAQGKK